MDALGYLHQTEYAVRHFYDGLASCWSIYKSALEHWDISRIGMPLTDEEQARAQSYVKQAGKYFQLKFSEATLAGAIVQVAASGIRIFSNNQIIPDYCTDIVPTTATKVIRYCIGDKIFDLPVGLILYAARNQYAHWEEDPFAITEKIFRRLSAAFNNQLTYDLAFDLENPTIDIYANEILLGGLRWTSYDKYLNEMEKLLKESSV